MATIGPATAADIPQLVDLLQLLFVPEADFAPDRGEQERGLRLIIASPQTGVIFVAREAGVVTGMVSLLFTISTAEGGPVCWLEDMVVRPDRRQEGLGARLLQHAIDYARAAGFCRITLLTDRVNDGARRFYARQGFVEAEMTALRLRLGGS